MTSGACRVCVCCLKQHSEAAFTRASRLRSSKAKGAPEELAGLEAVVLAYLVNAGPRTKRSDTPYWFKWAMSPDRFVGP